MAQSFTCPGCDQLSYCASLKSLPNCEFIKVQSSDWVSDSHLEQLRSDIYKQIELKVNSIELDLLIDSIDYVLSEKHDPIDNARLNTLKSKLLIAQTELIEDLISNIK